VLTSIVFEYLNSSDPSDLTMTSSAPDTTK